MSITTLDDWNLRGILAQAADQFGDRQFVIGERSITYSVFERHTNSVASWLRSRGVVRGDRILVLCGNRIEAILAAFASSQLGAIFVMIDSSKSDSSLEAIIKQCTPKVAVIDLPESGTIELVRSLVPILIGTNSALSGAFAFREIVATGDPASSPCPVRDLDPACLVYTSGSTGAPRGVIVSHDNIRFTTSAILERLPYEANDRVGLFLPLSFDYGLYQVFLCATTGASLLVKEGSVLGPEILEQIRNYQVTILPGTPTMVSILVRMLDRRHVHLPHLQSLTSTGEHLSIGHIEKLKRLIPGVRIFSMYGQTECKRISIMLPEELKQRPGSVGQPLPGTEAFTIANNGERTNPGQSGELVVRGRHVAQGYWGDPSETNLRFRKSTRTNEFFLHTGDICMIDCDGYIYFLERKDQLIKHHGIRMSASEVEEAAGGIAGVFEAAVVKESDLDLLHLFVTTNGHLGVETILKYLASKLDRHKVPDVVHVVADLPRTRNGKLDRKTLLSTANEWNANDRSEVCGNSS